MGLFIAIEFNIAVFKIALPAGNTVPVKSDPMISVIVFAGTFEAIPPPTK